MSSNLGSIYTSGAQSFAGAGNGGVNEKSGLQDSSNSDFIQNNGYNQKVSTNTVIGSYGDYSATYGNFGSTDGSTIQLHNNNNNILKEISGKS